MTPTINAKKSKKKKETNSTTAFTVGAHGERMLVPPSRSQTVNEELMRRVWEKEGGAHVETITIQVVTKIKPKWQGWNFEKLLPHVIYQYLEAVLTDDEEFPEKIIERLEDGHIEPDMIKEFQDLGTIAISML